MLRASKKLQFTMFGGEVRVSLLSLQGVHTWHLITWSVETEKWNVHFSMKAQNFLQQNLKRKPRQLGKRGKRTMTWLFHKSVKYRYLSDFPILNLWRLEEKSCTCSSGQSGLCNSPKLNCMAQNNHSESSRSCWGWSILPLHNAIQTTAE